MGLPVLPLAIDRFRVGTTKILTTAAQTNTGSTNTSQFLGQIIDKTNRYVYVSYSGSASTFYYIDRLEFDTNGNLVKRTAMTLSGFGTFSSAPTIWLFGTPVNNDIFIACKANGSSASFTAGEIYAASISGTTITLGSAISVPSVGTHDQKIFCYSKTARKLLVIYQDTSNFRYDACRLYNVASPGWSTPGSTPYALSSSYVRGSEMTRYNNAAQSMLSAADDRALINLQTTSYYHYVHYNFNTDTFSAPSAIAQQTNYNFANDEADDSLVFAGNFVLDLTSGVTQLGMFPKNILGSGWVHQQLFDLSQNFGLVNKGQSDESTSGGRCCPDIMYTRSGAGRIVHFAKPYKASLGGGIYVPINDTTETVALIIADGTYQQINLSTLTLAELYTLDLGIEYATSVTVIFERYGGDPTNALQGAFLRVVEY